MADEKEPESAPIGELLAAPIRAIQEAQISAEREYVRFVLDYGLEEAASATVKNKTVLKARNLEFEMKKSVPDPTNAGAVIERTASVSAPLLSVVNLPSVQIEEATIDLSLDVEIDSTSSQSVSARARTKATALRKALPEEVQPQLKLRGVIGNEISSRSLKSKGRLNVTIKLKTARDQDNVDRLVSLLNESISATISDDRKK